MARSPQLIGSETGSDTGSAIDAGSGPEAEPSPSAIDAFIGELQRLRFNVGDVPYSEIALRISRRRRINGASEPAARIARSTVFDAFRTGRQRLNADLIREIALALGEDDAAAEQWHSRCLRANAESKRSQETAATQPAEKSAAQARTSVQATAHPTPQSPAEPIAGLASQSLSPLTGALRMRLILVFLIACVGVNFIGNTMVPSFDLLLFLDMVGTATAAIALGPWYGVLVALLTNGLFGVIMQSEALPFTLVNVVGALAWGYGFRRLDRARTPLGYLLLNIGVAVICTLVALPINLLVFSGTVTHASNGVAAWISVGGLQHWVTVFLANLASSVPDKLISGYFALLVSRTLAPLGLSEKPSACGISSPPTRAPGAAVARGRREARRA